MKSLAEQLRGLDALTSHAMGGLQVQLQPIPGDVPVIQVSIEGREELPIFITSSDTQVLCMCYLWTASRRGWVASAMCTMHHLSTRSLRALTIGCDVCHGRGGPPV